MKSLLSCVFVLTAGWSFAWSGGYLGINIDQVEYTNQNQKTTDGVLVTGVVEGSPADKAGLLRDDIVESVNGEIVRHPSELISYLNNLNPGEIVRLKLLRNDSPLAMDVELGERILNRTLKDPNKWVFMSHQSRAWLGVEYMELTPELAEFFNVDSGLFIKSVVEGSPAENAGFQAGDIVLSMGGTKVESQRDFSKNMSAREEGDNVAFEINRKGKLLDFSVTLGKREMPAFPNLKFEFKSDGEFFNFDGNEFSELHELPEKLSPMLEMFEFQDTQSLQKQLQDLKEELEQLKKERKDN